MPGQTAKNRKRKGQLNYKSLGHGLSRQDADVTMIACHPATVAHAEQLLEAAYCKKRQTAPSPTLRCNADSCNLLSVRTQRGRRRPRHALLPICWIPFDRGKDRCNLRKTEGGSLDCGAGVDSFSLYRTCCFTGVELLRGSQWNAVRQTKSVARRVGEEVKGGRGFLKMMVSRKKEGG